MTAKARVRKSGPPKLPDFSARASGGSPPIETVAGTPGIDHRPDPQPLDAQRLDHGTAGLAAGHHQAARTGRDQPRSRSRPSRARPGCRHDRGRAGLGRLHLVGRRAGVDQHRPIGHPLDGPGDRLSRAASPPPAARDRAAGRGAWPAIAATCSSVAAEQEPARTTSPPGDRRQAVGQRHRRRAVRWPRKFSGSPMAMPEPPVSSDHVGAGRTQAAQILVLEHVGDGVAAARLRAARRSGRGSRLGPAPDHVERHQPDLARRSARCSTRTRLASVIGVSGWWRMWVSESSRSPTNRWPLKMVRPVSGKAGQAMVKSAPSASSSASATGPILPCVGAVEGRAVLEQVLPRPLPRQPALRRQRLRHRLGDRCRARLQRHHHRVGVRQRPGPAPARRSAAPCACRCAPACCTGRWPR